MASACFRSAARFSRSCFFAKRFARTSAPIDFATDSAFPTGVASNAALTSFDLSAFLASFPTPFAAFLSQPIEYPVDSHGCPREKVSRKHVETLWKAQSLQESSRSGVTPVRSPARVCG